MKTSEIEAKVRELATKHPDTIYQPNGSSCEYTKGTSIPGYSGCIIGVAIQMLYPERTGDLRRFDEEANGLAICDLYEEMNIEQDLKSTILTNFQALQDDGGEWGTCLKEAGRTKRKLS